MQDRARSLRRQVIYLLLFLMLLTGCAGERSRLRQHKAQEEIFQEAAKSYWHAVRWGYFDLAVAWLERGADRTALWEYLQRRQGLASLNEVNVYQVEVAEDLLTGTAYVSYQLLEVNAESVENRLVVQHWYRSRGKWFLKLEPDELKRLE